MSDEAPPTGRGSVFDAITPQQLELWSARRRVDPHATQREPPEPGYWLIRLGGLKRPAVPACIRWVHTTHEPGLPENVMDRGRFLAGFVIDEPASMYEIWNAHRAAEISEGEYRYHVDNTRWAKAFAPREAIARPRQRVDWFDQPPPF